MPQLESVWDSRRCFSAAERALTRSAPSRRERSGPRHDVRPGLRHPSRAERSAHGHLAPWRRERSRVGRRAAARAPTKPARTRRASASSPTCRSRAGESGRIARMTDFIPTLYVCHGDEGGPRIHPCRRVQEALNAAGIPYNKEIAAHGSPIPFLRKGSREELLLKTGTRALPTMCLPDGTVLAHSKAILAWISDQGSAPTGTDN
jgi:hypothetical protein